MARKAKPENSISDILAEIGVTHERDSNSALTGEHRLYFAGRFIGSYDAHAVGDLIREHLTFATTPHPDTAVSP